MSFSFRFRAQYTYESSLCFEPQLRQSLKEVKWLLEKAKPLASSLLILNQGLRRQNRSLLVF
ncbi:hypothetical protein RchiOBHm_Chr1g0342901 [Rosa chinensis]|uniref:Uncharacterized protein n=1 Tax=Rosa chinensis TaxID=74649 RepID=A0A2P6SE47_ROSCH|nr:hypothetical protein RchiOBHm_Chr1g0342901 [Rosa chinensis]